MLHRAKHGLITAKRGWTNSWIYLPVPLFLHLSVSLIHPLVSPRPCRMSEVSRSAAPLRSPFLNVSSTSTYRTFLSSTVEDSDVRARVWSRVTPEALVSVGLSDLQPHPAHLPPCSH